MQTSQGVEVKIFQGQKGKELFHKTKKFILPCNQDGLFDNTEGLLPVQGRDSTQNHNSTKQW